MNQICPRCGSNQQAGTRYCPVCGAGLSATVTQAKTQVMPSPTVSPPSIDVKTIVQRAHDTFGGAPIPQAQTHTVQQRELTVIATDVSSSMRGNFGEGACKLDAAIRAGVNLILNKGKLDAQDEIALVSFHCQADLVHALCPISSHKRQLIAGLQALNVGGGTDINAGLVAAEGALDWGRTGVVRRIILLTDGQGGEPLRTAEELKSRGVVIDVVGVGANPSGVDERLLREVASVVEGESCYCFIKDREALLRHYTQLANKTRVGA